MATTKVDIGLIDASGTASSGTFLRGDGAWQATGGQLINRWVVQTQATATGTTAIPRDNTTPTSSEGDQYLTVTTDTLADSSNRLRVTVALHIGHTGDGEGCFALFKDSDAAALAVSYHSIGAGCAPMGMIYEYAPGATTAVAFKIRGGTQSGSTTHLNDDAGAADFNAKIVSTMIVEEILP